MPNAQGVFTTKPREALTKNARKSTRRMADTAVWGQQSNLSLSEAPSAPAVPTGPPAPDHERDDANRCHDSPADDRFWRARHCSTVASLCGVCSRSSVSGQGGPFGGRRPTRCPGPAECMREPDASMDNPGPEACASP
jgi:hypothetical protein